MIMSNNTSSSSSGIFPSLLTVLFIGLKLTGHITWSWWWVLSPLWISALVGLTILAIVLFSFVIANLKWILLGAAILLVLLVVGLIVYKKLTEEKK